MGNSSFNVVYPNCAGIDLGSQKHFAALGPQDGPSAVRSFGAFTSDLREMGQWLLDSGVTHAFMEATGSYWFQVYEILESMGIEAIVVDARKVRRLPGRKTDVCDSQWIQQMGSYGLLSSCFVIGVEFEDLRTYHRHRQTLVESASQQVLRIHKALTEMNIQLHHVLSDIVGVSGLAILRAILAGERDPERLAELCGKGVKASPETVCKSLEGHWSDAKLLVLAHALETYDEISARMVRVDEEISKLLVKLVGGTQPKPARKVRKGQYSFAIEDELTTLFGTDLTQVEGFDTPTLVTLLAECGNDLSAFPSAKHFTSWLGLPPEHKITGGKVFRKKTRKVNSRAALCFRLAARSLQRSNCYLGAFLRTIAARRGMPKAITATARKLAVIFYSLVTRREAYKPKSVADYESMHKDRTLRALRKRAAQLGLALVPTDALPEIVC
jgi:transposase